ncbi:MAG: helix-turn-helix domain-containing protein [Rhodospirillales bacterium]|nr:helix-turn-helix domain-containing protein [Rhodospirillales bacterium]MDE0378602.1 helix-turn-helix domain-containing protein [Rhodospirillales bacterium]
MEIRTHTHAPSPAALALEEAAQGFAACGSEPRLMVLRLLVRAGADGLTVGEIQERTAIPASTLAHHLGFLAAGGLVEQERRGRTVVNRAAYRRIEALAAFLLEACCADARPSPGARAARDALEGRPT